MRKGIDQNEVQQCVAPNVRTELVARTCAALLLLCGINAAYGQRPPKTVSLVGEFQQLGLTPLAQGDRDVCSLFAITALAEYESNRHSASPKGRLSEEYLIWAANDACGKHHDQAMFYEAVQGLNVLGICAADRMPYTSKPDPNRKPSAAALADSESLRQRWQVEWIKRWSVDQRLTESELLGIKRALIAGHPVRLRAAMAENTAREPTARRAAAEPGVRRSQYRPGRLRRRSGKEGDRRVSVSQQLWAGLGQQGLRRDFICLSPGLRQRRALAAMWTAEIRTAAGAI